MEIAFMVFGFGFFIFVIYMIQQDDQVSWMRKIMEAKEFGLDDRMKLHQNRKK